LKDWQAKKNTLTLKLKELEESIKNNTEEIDDKDGVELN
jgi:hypothetical protein